MSILPFAAACYRPLDALLFLPNSLALFLRPQHVVGRVEQYAGLL